MKRALLAWLVVLGLTCTDHAKPDASAARDGPDAGAAATRRPKAQEELTEDMADALNAMAIALRDGGTFETGGALVVAEPVRDGEPAPPPEKDDAFNQLHRRLLACKGTKQRLTPARLVVDELVLGEAWSLPAWVVRSDELAIGARKPPQPR